MASPELTCWTLIEAAGGGGRTERDEIVDRYRPAVVAYLTARWRGRVCFQDLDDAAQEAFLEMFREEGVLARADRSRPGGFRAYLYGVVRNVAYKFEHRRWKSAERAGDAAADGGSDLDRFEHDEASLSMAFDRAWALTLLRQAFARQSETSQGDPNALQRIDLLRQRFQDGLPIREIAVRRGVDAARVHEQYRQARRDFKRALQDVVSFHRPGTAEQIEAECAELLSLLGSR